MKQYTKEEQKEIGAFYTPAVLADYLARTILSLSSCNRSKEYVALDPATGDSVLLQSLAMFSRRKHVKVMCSGIDIEDSAIKQSKRLFKAEETQSLFIKTDALYPFRYSNPAKGWERLRSKYLPNGIDLIISNPPWGANKDKYETLNTDFATAKGQFDIYDLFIETSIKNLNEGGRYAIIVPDSIYNQEHKPIREILLKETIVKRIVRLGEGFFLGVNIAVTLLFGIKKKSRNYKVCCSHLTNQSLKNVLKEGEALDKIIKKHECKIPVSTMVNNDYAFLTDIQSSDVQLMRWLYDCDRIGDYTTSQRGVELSKKGKIVRCPNCNLWFPQPKSTKEQLSCPHCSKPVIGDHLEISCIISDSKQENSRSIIVGEDIYRYNTKSKSYIECGYTGINYKDNQLYSGSKILVRKTGVGITAGIDYDESMTNQVVYILKRRQDLEDIISNEVILAILNSRITTYYIIKDKGSNGWRTHPYLSQSEVASLPFPKIDMSNERTRLKLTQITELVKVNAQGSDDNFSRQADIEIERIIAELFGFGVEQYDTIFKTLQEVQQMIPFKRLLKITTEDIFQHGI